MAEKPKNKGLGRGLSSLLADVNMDASPETKSMPVSADRSLPIEKVHPNVQQPRRSFTEEEMGELKRSIMEKGIIQPLIVRPHPEKAGDWEIVAGERRWRAAMLAELHEVPVIVRDLDDMEVAEIALIENIQREDLSPYEEAKGYQHLMKRFGHTQEQMAQAMGKSRSYIANLLRLLNLPDEVLGYLRDGKLTAGHARALVNADNAAELARQIIKGNLSVREVEALMRKRDTTPEKAPKTAPQKDADTKALEGDLSAHLGAKVVIDHKPGGQAGELRIKYRDLEQLDALCRKLTD